MFILLGGVLSELSESVVDELLNMVDIVMLNINEFVWFIYLLVVDEVSLLIVINWLRGKGVKSVYVKGGYVYW